MDTSEIDKTKITHNLSQHVGIKASNYQQAQSPLRETVKATKNFKNKT